MTDEQLEWANQKYEEIALLQEELIRLPTDVRKLDRWCVSEGKTLGYWFSADDDDRTLLLELLNKKRAKLERLKAEFELL